MKSVEEDKFITIASCPKCGGETRVLMNMARGAWAVCKCCKEEFSICGMKDIPVYNGIHIRRSTVNKVYRMWSAIAAQIAQEEEERKIGLERKDVCDGVELAVCPECGGETELQINRNTGAWAVCKACGNDYHIFNVCELTFLENGCTCASSIKASQKRWDEMARQIKAGTFKIDDRAVLLHIMADCLEARGYFPTIEQLDELFGIYEDCQSGMLMTKCSPVTPMLKSKILCGIAVM